MQNSQTHNCKHESKCTIIMCLAKIIFTNLFYYSVYFYYYLWVSLHFLILFIDPTVLFYLIFTFIYSTFRKKFQFQQNKQILNRLIITCFSTGNNYSSHKTVKNLKLGQIILFSYKYNAQDVLFYFSTFNYKNCVFLIVSLFHQVNGSY